MGYNWLGESFFFSVPDVFSIFLSAFAFSDAPAPSPHQKKTQGHFAEQGASVPLPPQELQMLCFVLELIQKWTILIVQQCYPNTML